MSGRTDPKVNPIIDLRSDTVTHPTPEMRQAMANAEVGDDVYGEDPTINRLEALSAERMGMEAALFIPSGTMGNLAAILAHCGRGDEIILGDRSHTFLYEAGGVAALGGVHPRTIPNQDDGTLRLEDILSAIRPDNPHFPISRLICIENTHNRCGGAVLTEEYTRAVVDLAQNQGLFLHIDGARIFNAAVALGVPAHRLAKGADSVTFCLSKGLCAPVGSMLCGSDAFIHKARRARKQLGGGMRQAGILAAAGIEALENMTQRLEEDHKRARALALGITNIPGLTVEKNPPPSNMVFIQVDHKFPNDAYHWANALKEYGVLIGAVDKQRIRLVVHYWITDEDIKEAVKFFSRVAENK
jgi:threonine aldolase